MIRIANLVAVEDPRCFNGAAQVIEGGAGIVRPTGGTATLSARRPWQAQIAACASRDGPLRTS
jgi:hypothetical protein